MIDISSAVVAALVAAVTAIVVQLLQRRQADRHRFTDLKRATYSKFLRELDDQGRQIRYQRKVIAGLQLPPEREDLIPKVEQTAELKLWVQEIRLLAPDKTGVPEAAKAALEALGELRRYRYDSQGQPPLFLHEMTSLDGFNGADKALREAAIVFSDRAKADLGAQ